tara:strand:- start:33 stop:431 length:399 start_codon:yes stop_codon:yes gene_type:complete
MMGEWELKKKFLSDLLFGSYTAPDQVKEEDYPEIDVRVLGSERKTWLEATSARYKEAGFFPLDLNVHPDQLGSIQVFLEPNAKSLKENPNNKYIIAYDEELVLNELEKTSPDFKDFMVAYHIEYARYEPKGE